MDREPPKGFKWSAEDPHYTWGFVIDPKLGDVAIWAQAASREDSRPHAILKFQPNNSFDYRVRYEPQLNSTQHSGYQLFGDHF